MEKTIKSTTILKPDFINTSYEEYLKWREQKDNQDTDANNNENIIKE